jgi:hypothetical protein
MRTSKWLVWLIVIIYTFTLLACSGNKETQPPSENPLPTQGSQPYPLPTENLQPYPAPQGDATPIDWATAKQYILNGNIWKIIQSTSLDIQLFSKDGKLYSSQAPNLDELNNSIKNCGDWCKSIIVEKK